MVVVVMNALRNTDKMDSNGNKVQTLRQQFEGLTHSEAPTILQTHRKLSSNQLIKGSNSNNNNTKSDRFALDAKHKPINNSSTTHEEMSANSLLKNGNRYGFISTNNKYSHLIPTSFPSSSSLPPSVEENNNVQPHTDSVETHSINGKLDSLPSKLRNSRRNGIYVSEPVIIDSGDNLVITSAEVLGNDKTNDNIMLNMDVDTDDNSSWNSQSNKGLHSSVNVKRSNAFRQRDVIDSPEPRHVRNSKLVLDRVKSLELPSSKNNSMSGTNVVRKNEDSSGAISTEVEQEKSSASTHRASSMIIHERPKSIATSMTKAVNVVTPYQVSDIFPSQSPSFHADRRSSEQNSNTRETPEYAVPIPVINNMSGVNRLNSSKHRAPEPPKYPPPPPVYKSPDKLAKARPYTSYHPPGVKINNHLENSPQGKRAASVCVSNPSNARGPAPEKPPRTFLYDILSDHNNHHAKNQFSLLTQNERNRSQSITPESRSINIDNTFYTRSPGILDISKVKPKVSISTAKIRQTTPNSASRVQDGKASQRAIPSTHQMLVRSKTESQIILKSSKLRVGGAGSRIANSISPPNSKSLGRNALVNHQSQLYLNQNINKNLSSQNNYEDKQQQLYNIMSNTNLLQRLHHVSNGPNTIIHPLRSESNLVLSVKEESRYDSSRNMDSNINNNILNHKLGLPPSPHRSSGKEFRISRVHSNSLLFMNNLISMSYGAQGSFYNNNNRRDFDNLNDDRILEKSKSEWALNRIGGYNNGSSVNMTLTSNHNTEARLGTRRNTVATPIPNLQISSSPLPIAGNCTPSTGHVSLESSTTTQSSGKITRPGIQKSIQNLVNQLFSPSSPSVIGEATKEATSSTDSGIQLGSESLSSCDTPVGDSTTDTGDSDCENDVETSNNARQVVEARKGYIRRVSSIRIQEIPSIHRFLSTRKPTSGENLFECLLVVGLNRDPYTGIYHPYIRDKFPSNTKLASGVEQFCFPDSLEWPCHEGPTAQSYTLAITDHRGARKYGCCYRILPEGANICIPIAYVIVSAHRAIGFYREVLKEITQRHGYTEYQKRYLMEDLFKKSFPAPTEDITVTDPIQDDIYLPYDQEHLGVSEDGLTQCYNNFLANSPKTIVLRRKADQRLEEGDLVTLLSSLDLTTLLKLFGSLLLERKVVLISRALSTLSLCVEALESMLYPFTWQHTFVPILPLTMTDVLDAPAPFLIGCLRSMKTPWDRTLDEGIVIDLDQSKVLSCVGDESNILPKRIHRKLRNALQFVLNMPDQKEHTKNVLTSECFIRMFVETLGHYSNHIVVQQDGIKIFERESFIKSSDTKATQNFLEWFSETSMFHEFIELRLKGSPPPGLFEQRILEQSELSTPSNSQQQQHNAGTPLTFKNAKFFMKGTRPFGNWLKEAFVK